MISPIEVLDLSNGISLAPRLKLSLTFYRSDPAVKPVDEWKLKLSLLSFLRSSLSLSVADDDLAVKKRADLHKRKRDDPVASGTLYIRDLGFLGKKRTKDEEAEMSTEAIEKRFLGWKREVLAKLGGMELNIEGVGFEMKAELPIEEDFEAMKRSWNDLYRNPSRGIARRPDTIIVKGVPSRWFAEPRVSSKPSMLVTHTIFSVLGKIKNLNVGDDDLGGNLEESTGEIVSGLSCKAWVQFENHDEFYKAMRVLCGRSMQKEGSRLKVDYEVAWDKDGFFDNRRSAAARNPMQERAFQHPASARYTRNEAPRHQPQVAYSITEVPRTKRFRE